MANYAPLKCPKCGCATSWREEIRPFATGVSTPFGRLRFGLHVGGGLGWLFRKPTERALGLRNVYYKCKRCGFRGKYQSLN